MGLADVIASSDAKGGQRVEPVDMQVLSNNLRRIYQIICNKVGDEAAILLWNDATKRKRGRRKGARSYDMSSLVSQYYLVSRDLLEKGYSRSAIIRKVSESAHANERGRYGSTLESINRKLLNEINSWEKFLEKLAPQVLSEEEADLIATFSGTSGEDGGAS